MTLKEQIGTMVFTQNQKETYIVGGSQRQNKELEEQTKYIISYNPSQDTDTVEISGIVRQEYNCENYNDILKPSSSGLPIDYFWKKFGTNIYKKVNNLFKDYYNNKLSESDIIEEFISYSKELRIYQTQLGNTSGINKVDNQQMILDMYELFQARNAGTAVGVCKQEGEKLAKQYHGGQREWTYYNSDYYYKTEDMREVLRNAAKQVAKEWDIEIEEADFKICEKESTVIGGLDFNSGWKVAAEQTYRCTMLNPQDVPPKNFTFYFQEHRNKYKHFDDYYCYEAQKGVIRISIGEDVLELDVPFDANQKEKQYFLAGDLVRKHASKEFIEKTEGFADHFFVFLRQFGTILNWYEFS